MRTFCIALVTPSCMDGGRADWWGPIFGAWPVDRASPRLEMRTPDQLIAELNDAQVHTRWDAVVMSPHDGLSESAICHMLDLLQQAMVPTLLLVDGPEARMDAFHPGDVLTQSRHADPATTSAMLYALVSRQMAVRQMDKQLRMAQNFQGETAAEIDRLHQELLLAARVQRDFMPKGMPQIPGLDAGVLFRPAGFVSGDTYDLSRLDEHHVSFFLADAMGHGVPAALMTLYLTGSLPRKEITETGYRLIPPAEALSRLNNGLQECMAGPARFATAVYGVADLRTGVVTMACAGHPAPLRINEHGLRPVDVSGMLLGVVADYEYEQVTLRLDPDELLVLHSDGIEGAFMPKNAVDDAPSSPFPKYFPFLAGMRRGASRESVAMAIQGFAGDLDAQAGSLHQDDDVTVLAIQLCPEHAGRKQIQVVPEAVGFDLD